jgi:alpha-beta hydrolase superfamily lysophospholipase
MSDLNTEAIDLIEKLGGNAKTAVLCEVSKAAVSQWRHNGIPKTQLKFIRAVRPEVFEEQPPAASLN